MKANNIPCVDYAAQGEQLRLLLRETTMEDALAMERSVIEIRTDEGTLVEAFPGYLNAVSVSFTPDSGTYQLTLSRRAGEGVGAALDAMAEKLRQTEEQNALLHAQLGAAVERNDFIEDCIAEMAKKVYTDV